MSYPLTSSFLKVERARKHLTELDQEVKAFVEINPYRLAMEVDPDTGAQVVRFRQVDDRPIRLPLRWGLMAGDVVHNLRSALDHVVFQLALAGGGDGNRSQFPIFENLDDYRKSRARLLKGVVDRQRAVIDALQPFHVLVAHDAGTPPASERDPLAINVLLMNLARLDNIDKHRLLLSGEVITSFRPPRFTGVMKVEGTHPSDWYRVKDGDEYFRITRLELPAGGSMAQVHMDAAHSFTIGFGDLEWGPFGELNDVWSNRAKGFATKADLALTLTAVEQVVGMFVPYFDDFAS